MRGYEAWVTVFRDYLGRTKCHPISNVSHPLTPALTLAIRLIVTTENDWWQREGEGT